jgi:hypothetical protein
VHALLVVLGGTNPPYYRPLLWLGACRGRVQPIGVSAYAVLSDLNYPKVCEVMSRSPGQPTGPLAAVASLVLPTNLSVDRVKVGRGGPGQTRAGRAERGARRRRRLAGGREEHRPGTGGVQGLAELAPACANAI